METEKNGAERVSDIGEDSNGGSARARPVSVALTPEQFERLYLQPGGVGGKGDLTKRFGNPTPIGMAAILLTLTPICCFLMQFGKSSIQSFTSHIGVLYILGCVILMISGLLEWVLGNTFPSLVFITISGFFGSLAILDDPSLGVAAAFSPTGSSAEGAANAAYNDGIAIYLICWGVLVFLFLLGSLRTNFVFVVLFLALDLCFFLLSGAYFRLGEGRDAVPLFKAGGAAGFITCCAGWYIELALVLGSTGIPVHIPLGDMSGFLAKRA